MPSKVKKEWGKKTKEVWRRGSEILGKSQGGSETFKPKNYLEILPSAHAQILDVAI